LYAALAQAGPDLDAAALAEVLQAGEALPSDTPGYVTRMSDLVLRHHPRFAGYAEADLAVIRLVKDALSTAATTSFGPHVIRYAQENLDDPRVPRTLHRLVFATRHACSTAPREISRTAFTLLHKHFPESEWAEKTPYRYGRN